MGKRSLDIVWDEASRRRGGSSHRSRNTTSVVPSHSAQETCGRLTSGRSNGRWGCVGWQAATRRFGVAFHHTCTSAAALPRRHSKSSGADPGRMESKGERDRQGFHEDQHPVQHSSSAPLVHASTHATKTDTLSWSCCTVDHCASTKPRSLRTTRPDSRYRGHLASCRHIV